MMKAFAQEVAVRLFMPFVLTGFGLFLGLALPLLGLFLLFFPKRLMPYILEKRKKTSLKPADILVGSLGSVSDKFKGLH